MRAVVLERLDPETEEAFSPWKIERFQRCAPSA
jgi:hypothetical protein